MYLLLSSNICIKMFNSFSEEVVATDGEEGLKSQFIKYMDTGY